MVAEGRDGAGRNGLWLAGRVTAFSLPLSRGAGFGRQHAVDYVWRQFMFERQHGLARVSPTGFVWLTVMADGALLMALASTMLTVPVVAPKLQRMHETVSRAA